MNGDYCLRIIVMSVITFVIWKTVNILIMVMPEKGNENQANDTELLRVLSIYVIMLMYFA